MKSNNDKEVRHKNNIYYQRRTHLHLGHVDNDRLNVAHGSEEGDSVNVTVIVIATAGHVHLIR